MLCAVRDNQEWCLSSDPKWCIDIFNNLQLYKRKGWMAKSRGNVAIFHFETLLLWGTPIQLLLKGFPPGVGLGCSVASR